MINTRSWKLPACVIAMAISAGSLANPKVYATEQTRNIAGGRKVLFVIPQTSIQSTYDDWELSPLALLGIPALTVAGSLAEFGINRELAIGAEKRIVPLRAALEGYEFDGPMQAALMPIMESSSWVRPRDVELTRDASVKNILQELDGAQTRQMLGISPRYYADHRFRSLVVSVYTVILVQKIPKNRFSKSRLKAKYVPFQQTFRCIVYLPDSENGSAEDNLARWSADNGALARRALDLGRERVRALFAQNLDGTEASTAPWLKRGKRKSETQSRMLGWVIEKHGDSMLFSSARDDALNYIEILRP
jgi:hypothetical protein